MFDLVHLPTETSADYKPGACARPCGDPRASRRARAAPGDRQPERIAALASLCGRAATRRSPASPRRRCRAARNGWLVSAGARAHGAARARARTRERASRATGKANLPDRQCTPRPGGIRASRSARGRRRVGRPRRGRAFIRTCRRNTRAVHRARRYYQGERAPVAKSSSAAPAAARGSGASRRSSSRTSRTAG
jgi:hypothetical protein